MTSHVPFLAVRPNEQFAIDVNEIATSTGNAVKSASRRAASKTSAAASKASSAVKKVEREAKRTAIFTGKVLQFPFILVLSLGLRLGAYTLASEVAGHELKSVSRDLSHEWQIGVVLGWKVLELIGVWYAEYDWVDLASLSLISNLPFYFLLNSFYQLSAVSIGTSLVIDIVSLTLPFVLFGSHIASTRDEDLLRPVGKAIAHDYQILALTSALASAIFAATLYISFASWLPFHMIEHFDNLRTLDVAHNSTIYTLATLFVPAGLAAMHFLFLPTVSASNALLSAFDSVTQDAPFDPENATLIQTVAYNLGLKGGMSSKTDVLIKRALALAIGSAINTFIRVFGTIEGAEITGALGWAGMWVGAITTVALVFRWVAE